MTIEERADYFRDHYGTYRSALIATLTEFEAVRRDVSDEAERILNCTNVNKRYAACLSLNRFIIPKPVEPLVAVADEIHVHRLSLEQALAKHGLKLVEVGDAD
jgi:hypothetical protein